MLNSVVPDQSYPYARELFSEVKIKEAQNQSK